MEPGVCRERTAGPAQFARLQRRLESGSVSAEALREASTSRDDPFPLEEGSGPLQSGLSPTPTFRPGRTKRVPLNVRVFLPPSVVLRRASAQGKIRLLLPLPDPLPSASTRDADPHQPGIQRSFNGKICAVPAAPREPSQRAAVNTNLWSGLCPCV